MTVAEEVLVHPTQASRVRLRVFEQPPERVVAGMGPDRTGYLVTEERIGSRTVVSTLGFLPTRDEALARMRARSRELESQHYRPDTTAA
jgi:hypothetical protein